MTKQIKLPTFKCKKCGHRWTPRVTKRPDTCPNCKNRHWDK